MVYFFPGVIVAVNQQKQLIADFPFIDAEPTGYGKFHTPVLEPHEQISTTGRLYLCVDTVLYIYREIADVVDSRSIRIVDNLMPVHAGLYLSLFLSIKGPDPIGSHSDIGFGIFPQ